MTDVTRILSAIEQGDPHAAEQLLPLVYDELCQSAAQLTARETGIERCGMGFSARPVRLSLRLLKKAPEWPVSLKLDHTISLIGSRNR
jgi:hypothetical protein